MAVEGTAARAAAVTLIGAVLDERVSLGQISEMNNGPLATLSPSDRARAQRLAAMTLRHLEQADRVLEPHLRKGPPRAVRNALRLGVVEMAIDGAAAHGVVNALVDVIRHGKRTGHLAGLVNAVLRKAAGAEAPFADMPPQRLPRWLRQPLVQLWGRDVVTAIEAVQALPPPLDLSFRADVPAIDGGVTLETGSLRFAGPVQVSSLPGYDTGAWWVQDAAAALAVRLLAPAPGETVLDLCAAPGGKTMQLAAAGAEVTALDISGPRLKRLHENLARTGLTATVVTADVLHWRPETLFDAVLLDAPCSATGTIRRHPDLPFVKDGLEIAGLVALQAQMIDRALGFVKPGGRLVFCTCSLLPEEGEAQLQAALARHPTLSVEQPDIPGVDPCWLAKGGGLRLRPDYWADKGGMDGFFMARLRLPA
tara:strand:- start:2440 stop:3708 length:1269 start_codon:yes stop_codon:yes gene_type:complete